ncbi:MAG: hypothetical protein Q8L68_07500 [Methylococcales bacterium]|nr:hypothetical protein [Methylococcales bacterium]
MSLNNIFPFLQNNQGATGFTWETLETFAAIFGALAWAAPWIYEALQKPTIKGKLISQHMNKGFFINKEGLLYFLSISIISLRKQFNIKEIKVKVKYAGDDKEYNGTVCWFRKSLWVDSDGKKVELVIPNNEFLGFMSTLPKDDSRKCYITFLVDKGTVEEFDYLKLEFIPYRGNTQTLKFNRKDIDPNLMLWDDNIWKRETSFVTSIG